MSLAISSLKLFESKFGNPEIVISFLRSGLIVDNLEDSGV